MPNIFTAADAKSSAAVSRIFGEQLLLIPMKTGRFTQGASEDTERLQVEFRGTLTGELGTQSVSGDRPSEGFGGVQMTTRDRTVTVQPHLWPAHAKIGDRIQAIEMPEQPMFEITGTPLDDGTGNRILVPLVKI